MKNNGSFFISLLLFLSFAGPVGGQNFVWARQATRTNVVTCGAVMDNHGNSYLGGNFGASATFDTTTITGSATVFAGGDNLFVAKYSPSGTFQNVWQNMGSGDCSLYGIFSDHSNHIYLMVQFEGDVTFGTATPHGDIGIFSYFIAKCDTSGNVLWLKTFNNRYSTGEYDIRPASLACDNNDDVYISGHADGTYTMDGIPVDHVNGLAFVARLNPADGTAIWVKQAKANNSCVVTPANLTTDVNNNLVFCGTYGGGAVATPCILVFNGTDTLSDSGTAASAFISIFDTGGAFLWARQIDSSWSNYCSGASADNNGNVFVAGNNFYAKYNSTGHQVWFQPVSFNLNCISTNTFGNYIEATFLDTFSYMGHEVAAPGNHEIIFKTDTTTGSLVWNSIPLMRDVSYSLNAYWNGALQYAANNAPGEQLGRAMFTDAGAFVTLLTDTGATPAHNNTIRGNVFNDTNFDCHREMKPGINGFGLVAEPGPYYTTTDSAGNYSLKVDTGNYSFHEIVPVSHGFVDSQLCPVTVYSVAFHAVNQVDTGINFANKYIACGLISVTETEIGSLVCNTTRNTNLTICNLGDNSVSGVLANIQYPGSVISPLSSTVPWTSYSTADSLMTFNLGTLAPDSCIHIVITDTVACSTPPYFTPFTYHIRVTPINSCYASDSMYNLVSFTDRFYIPLSGVAVTQSANELTFYPNPTTGKVTVSGLHGEGTVEVSNILGVTSHMEKIENGGTITLDLSGLPAGVYLVTTREQGTVRVNKVVRL